MKKKTKKVFFHLRLELKIVHLKKKQKHPQIKTFKLWNNMNMKDEEKLTICIYKVSLIGFM